MPDDDAIKSALVTIDTIAAELFALGDAMHSAYATESWSEFHDRQIELLRGRHGHKLDHALTTIGRRARWENRPQLTQRPARSPRRSRAAP